MCGMLMSMPSNFPKSMTYSFMASSILMPTKLRMIPKPYFR